MDYGVYLKKLHKNPSRRSAHHTKQSKFEGSDRQVRGLVLQKLINLSRVHEEQFLEEIPREAQKIKQILGDLEKEGFIKQHNNLYMLAT